MRISVSAAMSIVIASLTLATPVHAEGLERLVTANSRIVQPARAADDAASERADRQREAQREVDELREELAEANERSDAGDGFFGSLFGADHGADPTDAPRVARRPLDAGRAHSEVLNCRVCGVRAAGGE